MLASAVDRPGHATWGGMQGLKTEGDGQSDQGFRRSAPEDHARRASRRVLPVDQVSAALTRSRHSVSPDSDGPRSPFAINSVRRSKRGTHSQGSGSPGDRSPVQDNLDILSPTGGRRNLQVHYLHASQQPRVGLLTMCAGCSDDRSTSRRPSATNTIRGGSTTRCRKSCRVRCPRRPLRDMSTSRH